MIEVKSEACKQESDALKKRELSTGAVTEQVGPRETDSSKRTPNRDPTLLAAKLILVKPAAEI